MYESVEKTQSSPQTGRHAQVPANRRDRALPDGLRAT